MPVFKSDYNKLDPDFLIKLQKDLTYYFNNLDNDNVTLTLSSLQVKDFNIDWGIGANQVSGIDIPIADASSWYSNDTVEQALAQIGSDFSSHVGTTNIHYLTTNINHTSLLNVGTNTHAQIDTHISSTTNPHGSAYTVGNVLSTNIVLFATSDLNATNSLLNQIRTALLNNGLATT